MMCVALSQFILIQSTASSYLYNPALEGPNVSTGALTWLRKLENLGKTNNLGRSTITLQHAYTGDRTWATAAARECFTPALVIVFQELKKFTLESCRHFKPVLVLVLKSVKRQW